MEGFYDKSIPQLKALLLSVNTTMSAWQREAVLGYILLRDGVDYINTGNRYTRALSHFQRALEMITGTGHISAMRLDRARLYFWCGVAKNERIIKGRDDHVQRNREAIEFYKAGIREIAGIHGITADRVRACLYNSMGVALHHKKKHYIPVVAQQYYTRALQIAAKHPRTPAFTKIADRVMINSGRIWKLQGGAMDGGMTFNVVEFT